MKIELTSAQELELTTALKNKAYSPYHRRIQCILLRHEGMSLVAVGKLLGYSHQTVKNQVDKYMSEGLSAIVSDKRGGRNHSYMTVEEEQDFLNQQLSSALKGEFVTTSSLFEAYQEKLGRKTTREGFYALLKRHGWRKVTPRPQHPKKADAETILASKNKIFIRGENK